MPDQTEQDTSAVFLQFKQRISSQGGDSQSQEEESFMRQIAPRVRNMARRLLTNDVRKAFDSSDITSTVMRRLVGGIREGKLAVSTEGEFMSLLGMMTKNAVVDKHAYLHKLVRDQSRNHSLDQLAADDPTADRVDLTATDDQRRWQAGTEAATPVDAVLLAERLQALNDLCDAVRAQLQPDEWFLFKRRFLEDAPWSVIAEELCISDSLGKPSADAARMRATRLLAELRSKLARYKVWL
jgi:hypothetical protein